MNEGDTRHIGDVACLEAAGEYPRKLDWEGKLNEKECVLGKDMRAVVSEEREGDPRFPQSELYPEITKLT